MGCWVWNSAKVGCDCNSNFAEKEKKFIVICVGLQGKFGSCDPLPVQVL